MHINLSLIIYNSSSRPGSPLHVSLFPGSATGLVARRERGIHFLVRGPLSQAAHPFGYICHHCAVDNRAREVALVLGVDHEKEYTGDIAQPIPHAPHRPGDLKLERKHLCVCVNT